jgi:glycosyltransferase involved in cell wall biosynthesis
MPKVLLITHLSPNPLRSGGENRSYQILHDLQSAVGADNVSVFDPRAPKGGARRGVRIPWRLEYALRRLRVIVFENPYRVFGETHFSMTKFDHPELITKYRAAVDACQPDLVVTQHSACLWSLPFQRQRGIPTLVCPQNFDALDDNFAIDRKRQLQLHLGDLAIEVDALRQYDARFMISKVEAAFVSGMGSPSHFYPYVPVGAIRSFYESVRARRQPERGLFVLLGTAAHKPIRDGMRWLLDQLAQVGLPDGVRVIAAGAGTETLLAERAIPGVEGVGWLTESDLHDLLIRAHAMLLPKWRGFGSATRLPEMALAGIPVIASDYLTHAVDPLPGLIAVGRDGADWRAAIEQLMREPIQPPPPDFPPSTLGKWVSRHLTTATNGPP